MDYPSKEHLPLYTFSKPLSAELLGCCARKKKSVFVAKKVFRAKQGNNILEPTAKFLATYSFIAFYF